MYICLYCFVVSVLLSISFISFAYSITSHHKLWEQHLMISTTICVYMSSSFAASIQCPHITEYKSLMASQYWCVYVWESTRELSL